MIIKKNTLYEVPMMLHSNSYIIDIETTGFSPRFASIYMIGIIYAAEEAYVAEQWFCEKESDEYEMLFRLNGLLASKPLLYTYNGDQFDMPFIKKRMGLYSLQCKAYTSNDIMKVIRPYKKALKLENLKLKTLEAVFGYLRKDPLSGKELIDVYKSYLVQQDEPSLQSLLLHNYEDLLGLFNVIGHLPFFDMLHRFEKQEVNIDLHYSTIENGLYTGKITIDLSGSYSLYHPLFNIEFHDKELIIMIPVLIDQLYYFFPDPQNYYYLINEDYAIHKSVGQFVAKDHRVQGNKNNAYIKKEGFFLPCEKRYDLPLPLYHKDNIRKQTYVSVEDLVEQELFNQYIASLLSQISKTA